MKTKIVQTFYATIIGFLALYLDVVMIIAIGRAGHSDSAWIAAFYALAFFSGFPLFFVILLLTGFYIFSEIWELEK